MNLDARFWPNEDEIRFFLYASAFGPVGFFFATWIYGIAAGVVAHEPPLLQSAFSFLYFWLLGLVPSVAITAIVGIPYYSVLKTFGCHNPLIVAISGAPVMWLVTNVNPDYPYRELFICASAFVSFAFGAFLWFHKKRSRKCDS